MGGLGKLTVKAIFELGRSPRGSRKGEMETTRYRPRVRRECGTSSGQVASVGTWGKPRLGSVVVVVGGEPADRWGGEPGRL